MLEMLLIYCGFCAGCYFNSSLEFNESVDKKEKIGEKLKWYEILIVLFLSPVVFPLSLMCKIYNYYFYHKK